MLVHPEGISTFDTPGSGKNWWKLDEGTDIPPELELVNDRPGHWLFQPSRPMPLVQYKEVLHLITLRKNQKNYIFKNQ